MPTAADVTAARTEAQTLGQTAGEMEAGTFTVGDLLKKKATEAYKASQDIVQPLDVATQEYLGAPQEARVKYQDIFNPFSRENLIQQYTSGKALPMMGLQSVLGQRFGGIGDIISEGTGAYQAQATAAQNKAQLARQLYGDVLGEYEMEEEQRRYEQEWPFKQRAYEYEEKRPYFKDTGDGGFDIEAFVEAIRQIQQLNQPSEPKPTYTPSGTGGYFAVGRQ